MKVVYSVDDVREIDRGLEGRGETQATIDRVGRAVALKALELMGGCYGKRVLVEVGRGNNGEDGRAAGRVLKERGAKVIVIEAGSEVSPEVLGDADLYLDAVLGVGVGRPYQPRELPKGVPVLSVDLPSGIDPMSGTARGAAVVATATAAVGALKRGHLLSDAMTHCGAISIVAGEIATLASSIGVIEDADVLTAIPLGSLGDHKWKRSVMVVAGSPTLPGAAIMAAKAAYRLSGGIVHLYLQHYGADDSVAPKVPFPEQIVVNMLESLWAEPVVSESERFHSLVIGPGVGRGIQVANFVRRMVANASIPVIVDADAIYAFQTPERLLRASRRNEAGIVITPHEGEFEGLFGPSGLSLGSSEDRIDVVQRAAAACGCVVVLKGSPTIVAAPNGQTRIVVSGSSMLSIAGSGDVLSGIIGGLLARGVPPLDAASIGAHIHGRGAQLHGGYSLDPDVLLESVVSVLGELAPSWHHSQPASTLVE